MTDETKRELFYKMNDLEKNAEQDPYNSYKQGQINGAFKMLITLKLTDEYWKWCDKRK